MSQTTVILMHNAPLTNFYLVPSTPLIESLIQSFIFTVIPQQHLDLIHYNIQLQSDGTTPHPHPSFSAPALLKAASSAQHSTHYTLTTAELTMNRNLNGKFAAVVGLIKNGDESAYGQEVNGLVL